MPARDYIGLLPSGVRTSLLLLFLVIVAGTIGYHFIEGASYFNSLYWTVETVTTVGYGDLAPSDFVGRTFAVVIMLLGVGLALYSLSSIVSFTVGGGFKKAREVYRMEELIENMKDHIIVCGYGRVGRRVVAKLISEKRKVLVLDSNELKLKETENGEPVLHIIGDAVSEKVLMSANIKKASAIVSCIPDDSENLYLIMEAKELNPSIFIVVRATKEESIHRFRRLGANEIILPEEEAASKMANVITMNA